MQLEWIFKTKIKEVDGKLSQITLIRHIEMPHILTKHIRVNLK